VDRSRAELLLAELKRRRAAELDRATNEDRAAKLRGFFYPKQAAFFRSKHRRRATKKTRRSGATTGGCHELLARSITIRDFAAVYAATTLAEAKSRVWRSKTKNGFVDIIERHGERLNPEATPPRFRLGAVVVTVREGDLQLIFDNGSSITLFGANHEQATTKLKGEAYAVYWIDEAQDFTWLEAFYKATITAGQTDFEGEVWLTGTPCQDLQGFFYEVTKEEAHERLKGWEVHHFAVTDNPFYGRVMWEDGKWFVVDNMYGAPKLTPEEWEAHKYGPFATEAEAEAKSVEVRWERTAGEAKRENGWDDEDPDFLRDWKAIWVKGDARFVYDVHKVPDHELVYAPMRLAPDGYPDITRALMDLPGWADRREYLLGVGSDLGTTRAFSWVLVAWSQLDPILYEVASWKKTGLDYNEMAAALRAVQAQTRVGLWVADAGGGGKPAVAGWSKEWMQRYQLPITEAIKPNKIMAIRQWNADIRARHFQFREGSPLLAEMKAHRWAPLRTSEGKLIEDPSSLRDVCDGGLYIHRHSYHFRWRLPVEKVKTGSPEWAIREEAELLDGAQGNYDG